MEDPWVPQDPCRLLLSSASSSGYSVAMGLPSAALEEEIRSRAEAFTLGFSS